MIWASEPPPVDGQCRVVRRFAWLPVREYAEGVYGHRVVWLQHYICHEKFQCLGEGHNDWWTTQVVVA